MKVLLLIIIFLNLFSCKQKQSKHYEKSLIGEWKFIKSVSLKQEFENIEEELVPPPAEFLFGNNYLGGFEFFPDKTCEVRLGFFKMTYVKDDPDDRRYYFFGTTSQYKIEDDSLKIFNLSDSVWSGMKIYNITNDTLNLQINDSILFKYKKVFYKTIKKNTFDTIIISSSGCYGSCPISNTLISRKGKVVYVGERFNIINGYFTSIIANEQFEKLEKDFNKANFENLNKKYIDNSSDEEELTITFIKDGRIIKTITDYGRISPNEFINAYYPLRFLYQRLKLDTLKNYPNEFKTYRITFEVDNKILELEKSEGFYLWNLLRHAKAGNKSFKKKYNLIFYGYDNDQKIETDGQFYKIIKLNGKSITLDLGYNFLERNNLNKKIKEKE